MLWLLVFGLIAACAVLLQRLRRAEERLARLEETQVEHGWQMRALAATRHAQQAEGAPSPSMPDESPEGAVRTDASPPEAAPHADAVAPGPSPAPVPAVAEQDQPEPPAGPRMPRFAFDFEDIFGRRMPIWAGGITLAVAGVFLVRYSIEAGLLTPTVRVALSFLFGVALIAGAELAYRFEDRVRDERVRQALAGAGLATLYAAFYLAGTQYALIGQTLAFLGLAGVTALAIFLSYRFGLPSAVLGLVGGFAAPALVGGEDANLPMLALYLALVTGGLTQTANRQGRSWLGLGALIGGLGWGTLLLLSGDFSFGDMLALGLYIVLLGTLVPALLDIDHLQQPIRLAAAAMAGLQLAVLVDTGGYEPLVWSLYLLLGAALAWLGWARPELRAGSAMAAAIGVVLLALWPSPAAGSFTVVAASIAAIFALVPLALLRLRDGTMIEALSIAAVPLGIGLVAIFHYKPYGDVADIAQGLGQLALASVPAAGGYAIWKRALPGAIAANLGSASVLFFLACLSILPDDWLPFTTSANAIGLAVLLRERAPHSRSLTLLQWLAAGGTLLTVLVTNSPFAEVERLYEGAEEGSLFSLLRWLAAVLPFAAIACWRASGRSRVAAEFLAGLMLFAALGQVLPPVWLAWVAAALAAGIALRARQRAPVAVALIVCMSLWAAPPAIEWLERAQAALAANPMFADQLPSLRQAFGFILPLALALGASRNAFRFQAERRIPVAWLALAPALIVVHTLYKQVFGITSTDAFEFLGLAERTVWQGLLLGAAWAVWRAFGLRLVAVALAAAALAHFLYFSGLLHNPLWSHQAVGPLPLANLVLGAYGVGIGALLSLRHWHSEWRRGVDCAIMVLATLGAITLLRQMFAGSFLDLLPMSQAEDLLRSLVGILLAIAFLLIGSLRGERLWRVGSLVLMTGTVLKVFIVDTAGLEGLLRIASFVALGASLIGIGWFYSRQLKAVPAPQ